ncbi:hypothetical protein HD806DRAFT_124384 [Xylariaceae sp. AK1471]|nr:hypothetical protein HD806DRAFT_124384 [Xylariaceae sp. AK1471]
MSSRGRNYDHTSTQRSRSRTGAFLGALEGGHVHALGTLKPSSQVPSDHRHHSSRAYDYYDEAPPRRSHGRYDDAYYYDSSRPQRRHRSAHHDDDQRRHHSHHNGRASSSHGRRGLGSGSGSSSGSGPDLRQAAGAAVTAGVVEAWRSRHDADRTIRVATAAIGAAATDSALGRRGGDRREKRHVVESALAGLVENRVINGSRG